MIEVHSVVLLPLNQKCLFLGNCWTEFNQSWRVLGYTMQKSKSKKLRQLRCAAGAELLSLDLKNQGNHGAQPRVASLTLRSVGV